MKYSTKTERIEGYVSTNCIYSVNKALKGLFISKVEVLLRDHSLTLVSHMDWAGIFRLAIEVVNSQLSSSIHICGSTYVFVDYHRCFSPVLFA